VQAAGDIIQRPVGLPDQAGGGVAQTIGVASPADIAAMQAAIDRLPLCSDPSVKVGQSCRSPEGDRAVKTSATGFRIAEDNSGPVVTTYGSPSPWWTGPLILAGASAIMAAPAVVLTAVAAGAAPLAAAGAAASAVGTGGKLLAGAAAGETAASAQPSAPPIATQPVPGTVAIATPQPQPPPAVATASMPGLQDLPPALLLGAALFLAALVL
jgi:hypothetical protein